MAYVPYGYYIKDGKALADPLQSARLTGMYREYLQGSSVIKAARAAGIDLPRTTLSHMLSNQSYLGDGFYPPIIDPALYEQVQAERQRRHLKRGPVCRLRPVMPNPVQCYFTFARERWLAGCSPDQEPAKQASHLYSCIMPDPSGSRTMEPHLIHILLESINHSEADIDSHHKEDHYEC